jgi:CubicO group peptidase (beta-lactamase class C family)
MKKILLLIAFACISNLLLAQDNQQHKTDSVCQLFKKYFNEKNSEQLYELAGETFKKALPLVAFKAVCDKSLFPLGEFKEPIFENYSDGVSKYKAVFSSMQLAFLLVLDKNDKIETFQFQPYVNDKTKKNYKVSSTNKLTTPLDKQVDSAVQPYITMQATTGLSIGILKDGKTIFYGYGETAKGNKQIPDENTIFEIGSISKTFTATLLADAVNMGKLKLDDPVNKYLPDSIPKLEYEGYPITLKALSNHSSGISGMPSNFNSADITNPYKDYDTNMLFSFYRNFRPERKPGEKYEYSNLAVGTLGVILERVYRKNYEALFVEKICDPLNMNDTRQFIRKNDSARFAKGYNENGLYNSQWDFKALAGAGAIRSTASDFLKYAKGNLGDAPAPLNKAMQLTHVVTFTAGSTKVGLVWHYIKPGNDEVIFHNGGTGGYRSYLAINPQKKFAVVILSNTSIGAEETGNTIMKWLEINL